MKSKMWPRSSTNQLSKGALFLLTLFLFLPQSQAKDEYTPGVIESLERLIDIHRKQMNEVNTKIKTNPKLVSELAKIKDVRVDPYFMKSIIFYSDRKYLDLMKESECTFLTLLDAGLLKTVDGSVTNLAANFQYNSGGELKTESALISKNDYLSLVTKKKCESYTDIFPLFKDDKLKKTTSSQRLEIPRDETGCHKIFSEWKRNPHLPYYCSMTEAIASGKKAARSLLDLPPDAIGERRKLEAVVATSNNFETALSPLQHAFFESLCHDLDNEARFCSRYRQDDVWNRVVSKEKPEYLMLYLCQTILGKKGLSGNDFLACKERMSEDRSLCHTTLMSDYPSLIPHQSCQKISQALSKAKLMTDFSDCPGRTDNEGIVNTHRLLMHFEKKKILSTSLSCADEATMNFAQLNLKFEGKKAWPLEICYPDPGTQQTECLPYIPGSNSEAPESEIKIIAKILAKMKGLSPNTTCEIASQEEFNPNFLKFKTGCFVIYDPKTCTTLNCSKRIFYDLKELSGITYRGRPLFDYFPTSFSNEYYSTRNLLKLSKKIDMKPVKNLSDLIFFLSLDKESIVHGIACLEDLVPHLRVKRSINQCSPTPFIIDGTYEEKNNSYVVVRLSTENIHHPRLILWQNLFSAIGNYKELHPLKTWTLYGVRKN